MYKLNLLLLGLATLVVVQAGFLGHRQAVNVKGKLFCGNTPAFNTSVLLFDDDTGGIDDKMDEGFTSTDGSFNLNGYVREMGQIDPFLKIKHDCPIMKNKDCERMWRIKIPPHYIRKSMNKADVSMDLGVWNMQIELPGETKKCKDKKKASDKTHRHRRFM